MPVYEVFMKLEMRNFSLVAGLFAIMISASFSAEAETRIPYYGEKLYQSLQNGVQNEELIQVLNQVLSSAHIPNPQGLDVIASSCNGSSDCYQHHSVSYDQAREIILGEFYLVQDGDQYAVKDVYCEKEYGADDFKGKLPGPHKIPDNTVVNVEHTWPQSRFTSRFPKSMQKSDLHHLFATDSEMNSTRGNFPFGEVSQDKKTLKCQNSRIGMPSHGNQLSFEPPQAHKGNVARALFYFAVRYNTQIDPNQEAFLRKWHHEDAVDQEEIKRNEEIFNIQKNRNPFIDNPDWVDKISDF